MAGRLAVGRVETMAPEIRRLYFHVIADAATDYLEWPDGTAIVSTHKGDPGAVGLNEGIKYIARTGAGAYTVYLQDNYYAVAAMGVFTGDESTTDDKSVGFTMTSAYNSVQSGSLGFVLYDDAGNAQEVTDGNHIFGWMDLYNKKP